MKKVEIITKANGKKKSKVIKIKCKEDLTVLLGLTNYCMIKDKIADIDLTEKISFKIDGKKSTLSELRSAIKSDIHVNEKKDDKYDSIDTDGRFIIESRRKSSKKKPKDKDKKNKKKNKKGKK